jgi:prepilin-type N-terminal cleavage/methylation domain-containing protein
VKPRPQSDRGDTLVEVIVTIVILAIVAAGLLAGMTTTTASSNTGRQQADAEALLTSIGEAVKDPTQINYACTPAGYTSQFTAKDLVSHLGFTGWTAKVNSIALWDGADFDAGASCNPVQNPNPMQEIDVQVGSPDGQLTWSREIVRGEPR